MIPHHFAPEISKAYQEMHDSKGVKMSTLVIAYLTNMPETKACAGYIGGHYLRIKLELISLGVQPEN